MALTAEQKAARTSRRMDILTRVAGSGELTGDAAAQLARDIETFEWASGDEAEAARRRAVVAPLLGSGAVRMQDIVSKATASLATLDDFGE